MCCVGGGMALRRREGEFKPFGFIYLSDRKTWRKEYVIITIII